jgi:enoyl-CoA hydratase/carnithine racemase
MRVIIERDPIMLPYEIRDGVHVMFLQPNPEKPRGGVVVLDAWLIGEITATLTKIATERPKGFVLASASTRVFVAGADLAEIDALDDDALEAYLIAGAKAFALIPALGCPSAAAIHGATLGGGLEIAMHCDALVAAMPAEGGKPWQIGLPEAGLCICPGWGGTQMLPARILPKLAMERTATGTTWSCFDVPTCLFDTRAEVGSGAEGAIAAAIAWVKQQDASSGAFMATHAPRRAIGVRNSAGLAPVCDELTASVGATSHGAACLDAVRAGLASGWNAAIAFERSHLIALRHTAEARAKLDGFLKK